MDRITKSPYVMDKRFGDVEFNDPSLAQQHFAEEVDINNIMSRLMKTGLLADSLGISNRQAIFGDFSSGESFTEHMIRVTKVTQAFSELPAELRGRFNNDPAMCIDFMSGPANLEECVKLGLLPKEMLKAVEPAKPVETGAEPEGGAETPPVTPPAA